MATLLNKHVYKEIRDRGGGLTFRPAVRVPEPSEITRDPGRDTGRVFSPCYPLKVLFPDPSGLRDPTSGVKGTNGDHP